MFNKIREETILRKIQSSFGPEVFTPGLERTKPMYQPFIKKLKSRNIKTIIVGGTNGKGQTSHSIGHYLKLNDKRFALWTSPHILSICERFNLNGINISYNELEKYIDKNLLEINRSDFKVSFYEFLFLIFLDWASTHELDFLVLEVGLGGRLDAVNHFDADLTLITSISRDHQSILGNSYEKILFEKLGITRSSAPLITSFKLEYLIELTEKYCQKNNIRHINLAPKNDYYESNIQMAQHAICFFNLNIIENEIAEKFKGREEKIYLSNVEFNFIGAHNPEGVRVTLDRLARKKINFDNLIISFSNRENVDLIGMLKMIISNSILFEKIYLTRFEHPKAISIEILQDVLLPICNNKIILELDWKKLIDEISQNKEKTQILVAGSYYFIGEVQSYISNI